MDENKINYVSRVIYSTFKKANSMASNGVSPQKALTLDKEAEEMLLRVLTQAELKSFTNNNDFQEFLNVKDRLALDIKEIVERRGCSFAFPSQSLYIEKS